jgi:hypothetical protein
MSIDNIPQNDLPVKWRSSGLEAPNQGLERDVDDHKQHIWIKNRLQLVDRKMLAASLCEATHHKQTGDKEKRRHMEAVDKGVGENSSLTDPPSAMDHSLGGMAVGNQSDGDTLHNVDDV